MTNTKLPRSLGLAALTLVSALAFATLARAQNNCITCHQGLEEENLSHPAAAMEEDVHDAAGITCADCHGGDPTLVIEGDDYALAKASGTGYVGKPSPGDIPTFCGKCHSDAAYMQAYDSNLPVDQLAQYWTSHHGEELRDGDDDVAQCVSCHGSHGMLTAEDPGSPVYPVNMADTCGSCHADETYMDDHGLSTDQVASYRESVHGKALYEDGDLGSPTCNTCHGNHGATPPDVSSISLVCGTCHAIQKEFFDQSPHLQGFEDSGDPECETCHDYHAVEPATDAFLGVDEGQICGDCHYDEGEKPYVRAKALRADIEDLKTKIAEATAPVHEAAIMGMEVSDAELVLIDANQSLMKARNAIHTTSDEIVGKETDEGRAFADEAREMGLAALDELQYRRKGLAVAVFFIMLVVIGLYLKIRRIEARPESERS